MDLTNLETIKNLLFEETTSPRKEFGQNFLVDKQVLDKLVTGANINKEDVVIEVGPGIGTVTEKLASLAKKVYTFEIDPDKLPILKRTLRKYSNVTVINKDFLQVYLKEFLQQNNIKRFKFVSSLPYNISKKILQSLLECEIKPDVICVLIQKEVAEKYVPNNKNTFLSNYLQLFARGEILHSFGPHSFYPQPTVDSAILKISVHQNSDVDPKLIKFIKSGFMHPRKKLINVLSSFLHTEVSKLCKIFNILNLSENSRAEDLTLSDWIKLYKQLN